MKHEMRNYTVTFTDADGNRHTCEVEAACNLYALTAAMRQNKGCKDFDVEKK